MKTVACQMLYSNGLNFVNILPQCFMPCPLFSHPGVAPGQHHGPFGGPLTSRAQGAMKMPPVNIKVKADVLHIKVEYDWENMSFRLPVDIFKLPIRSKYATLCFLHYNNWIRRGSLSFCLHEYVCFDSNRGSCYVLYVTAETFHASVVFVAND